MSTPSKTSNPSSSMASLRENSSATTNAPTIDFSTLILDAQSRPESYYVSRMNALSTIAASTYWDASTSFTAAAAAQNMSAEDAGAGLSVITTLLFDLLATRNVRKDTALLALAKRQDGYSEHTMQEAWDEAWDQKTAEVKAVREARERVRAEVGRGNLPQQQQQGVSSGQTHVSVGGSAAGGGGGGEMVPKGPPKKKHNKNGSQKRKEKRDEAKRAGSMNGGVNVTKAKYQLGG